MDEQKLLDALRETTHAILNFSLHGYSQRNKAVARQAAERAQALLVEAEKQTQPDIRVENHGSLFLLRPASDAGREWLAGNISPEASHLGDAVACEPRYVADIVNGAREDGLGVA